VGYPIRREFCAGRLFETVRAIVRGRSSATSARSSWRGGLQLSRKQGWQQLGGVIDIIKDQLCVLSEYLIMGS
jgi:hypothetical protein